MIELFFHFDVILHVFKGGVVGKILPSKAKLVQNMDVFLIFFDHDLKPIERHS